MDFIGRATWGARYAAGSGPRPIPCSEVWLHHTVTAHLPVDATVEQECEQMRRVEAIGQQRFGKGFSYNLALFPSGRAYVGCGVRRVGTHTGGRNTRALGIALVGDFDKHPVPAQLEDALVQLLQYGKQQGWIKAAKLDGGHRDLKATACPGRHAYHLIPAVNARAAGQPVTPSPAPSPTPGKGLTTMLIVLHPDGHRQYLCTEASARHIGMPERNVLIAGGVQYVGADRASAEDRGEFLRLRGVEL